MSYSNIYKQILSKYSKKKANAEIACEELKKAIYSKLPRLQEIDNELFNTGLNISRLILADSSNKQDLIESIKEKNNALVSEKNVILLENGLSLEDLKPKYECMKCNDTGFIDNKACSCLEQQLIEESYSSSNLKTVLDEQNFDNFDFSFYSDQVILEENASPLDNIRVIYQIAHDFVMNFDSHNKNLLFYGSPGTGKTFLCSCIAKDLLDKKKSVIYITAFDLFKLVEDVKFNKSKNKSMDYDYINFIFNADLLIIDDLGTEFHTSLSNAELFNCLNTRLLNKKSTVISTNFSLPNLTEHYSERIISRITGNYTQLKFFGRDIRQLKKFRG